MAIPIKLHFFNMAKLEQQIQSKRIKELEELGYYVIKLVVTNKNGIPDIIALHPTKGVLFSEVKRPGHKPTKLQEYRHKELRDKGFEVEIYTGE